MDLLAIIAFGWFLVATLGCVLTWAPPVRRRLGGLRHPLLVAAAAAVAVRLVPAALPLPHDAVVRFDIDSYRLVAAAVLDRRDVYDLVGRYPYLPLHMYVFAAAAWLADHSGLPFAFVVKLPEIAADAVLTVLVGWAAARLGRRRDAPALAMVFALNPVSLLVTGYHGQFDAVPTALVFGAWAVLVFRRERWALVLSAVLLGLAIADKTWPALLAPVLLWRVMARAPAGPPSLAGRGNRWYVGWWQRHAPLLRGAAYGAVATIPVIGCFALYEWLIPGGARHALEVASSYQGIIGAWGFSHLLVRAAGTEGRADALAQASSIGPWVLLAALAWAYTAAASIRRDLERMAVVLLTTFGAAAGWGVHWLAWLAPIAIASGRRWSVLYLAAAGCYTASIYLGFGGILYGAVWLTDSLAPLGWATTFGLILWAGIAAVALVTCIISISGLGSQPVADRVTEPEADQRPAAPAWWEQDAAFATATWAEPTAEYGVVAARWARSPGDAGIVAPETLVVSPPASVAPVLGGGRGGRADATGRRSPAPVAPGNAR